MQNLNHKEKASNTYKITNNLFLNLQAEFQEDINCKSKISKHHDHLKKQKIGIYNIFPGFNIHKTS